MRPLIGGGLLALLLSVSGGTALADVLVVSHFDGRVIARVAAPEGTGWCILWNHSVKGFPVSDCYENRAGRMVLVNSQQPDFAAGLGHIPGRGRLESDGKGGYRILDINEPVPGDAYVLRPGAGAVDHRLMIDGTVLSLSAIAPRARIRIALVRE